ncbi:MAG: hypothetical protein P1U56_16840 [Saprospiraceae bacterium]|nr:hypothetical protein [Saprospiraceae bacterium]
MKYFLNGLALTLILSIVGCQQSPIIYKRIYSEAEQLELAESLLNSAGTGAYYQGSVGERLIIKEANAYNPKNAWGMRELGVPYLKRGMAHEANEYYSKAVELDPKEWLGYKAYCWLYFYRDYKTSLDELNRFDAMTPDFVDYPQSTSVNYMKGLCYIHLGQYEEAIEVLTAHLKMEIEEEGLDYVDAMPFLSLGMAYQRNEAFEKADSIYSLGLKNSKTTSDLHYHKAVNLYKTERFQAAKESLDLAREWYTKGGKNERPYVEEFFAIYQEDIDQLQADIQNQMN